MGCVFSEPSVVQSCADRVQARTGRLSLSGRYHRWPRKLEDDYDLTSTVLGTGLNGEVRLAIGRDARADRKYAVKSFGGENDRRHLEKEVEIFLSMDHPHIVSLVDVYETSSHLHLVMECMEGGELRHRLKEKDRFPEQEAANAIYQILLAINYLHSQGIAHRDIKLDNILYERKDSDHLKLTDFGFSQLCNPNATMKGCCGTLRYMAPEVLASRSERSYTHQCDMWSLGVIAFLLFSGVYPFSCKGDDIEQRKDDICNGRYTMSGRRWEGVSSSAKDFVRALLKVDPSERLTAQQALEHDWIVNSGCIQVPLPSPRHRQAVADRLLHFGQASEFRRACMSMLALSVSNYVEDSPCRRRIRTEGAEARQLFLEINKSRQGTITTDELRTVLVDNLDASEEDIKVVINAMVINEGRIRYSDFLAAMLYTGFPLHEDMVWDAFNRFDTDSTGYITSKNVLHVLGLEHQDEAEALIAEADFFGDGKISFGEFVRYVEGGSAFDRRAAMLSPDPDQHSPSAREQSAAGSSTHQKLSLAGRARRSFALPAVRCAAYIWAI